MALAAAVIVPASPALGLDLTSIDTSALSGPPKPTVPKTISPLSTCGTGQVADGVKWNCTFDDEFNGAQLDRTKWIPQQDFPTGDGNTHACYVDDPSVVSTANGALHLSIRKVDTPVTCGGMAPTNYISGQVSTYHMFSQQYGRFSARLKVTATTIGGLHEAFWMWPDDRYSSINWPSSGEIDTVETYSNYPDLAVPFLHYGPFDNFGSQEGTNTAYCKASRGVWNNYDLVWNAQYLAIYVNGSLCLANTSHDDAFNKRYIMLFSQAMGAGTDAFSANTPLPATMDVDYARSWQYAG
jgi:beta-glucanase (GH16 family)